MLPDGIGLHHGPDGALVGVTEAEQEGLDDGEKRGDAAFALIVDPDEPQQEEAVGKADSRQIRGKTGR